MRTGTFIPLLEEMVRKERAESLIGTFRTFNPKLNVLLRSASGKDICQVASAQHCINTDVPARLGFACAYRDTCWETLSGWIDDLLSDEIKGNWGEFTCRGVATHQFFKIRGPHGRPVGGLAVGGYLKLADRDTRKRGTMRYDGFISDVRSTVLQSTRGINRAKVDQVIKTVLANQVYLSDVQAHAVRLQAQDVATELAREFAEASLRTDVWVAMPFAPRFDDTYLGGIRKTLMRLGYKPKRADYQTLTAPIMEAIREGIKSSAFVIADFSGANANVLYEIGFADALDKRVFLLTSDDSAPFSVRERHYVKYQLGKTSSLIRPLKKWISDQQKNGVIAVPDWARNGARAA